MRPLTHSIGLRAILPLLAAVVCVACHPMGRSSPQYQTAPVTRGDLLQHVTATGSLSAVVSVDVGSQVSGKISHLYADFNSGVKKGQLVAEIDPTLYAAALRQAQGDLASARADVILKRQNLKRKNILVPLRAASQLDLDQATAELAQAEASVMIKEAAVESAQANLGYCRITAPVDGIVISRKVDIGQTLIAAMTTPVLFTIAQDITKMNITADVSEADVGRVRAGEAVDFSVDAFPDELFHGEVSQVRRAATVTQNVVTYQTIIAVKNPGERLFPGMTADVSILVAERRNVLMVSNAALRYTPPEGVAFEQSPPKKLPRSQQLVYELAADGLKLRPVIVQTGVTDGVDTEIAAGVVEGTALVTSTPVAATTTGVFGSAPPPPPPAL
jgi:HlyD family secretion protein